MVSVGFWIHAVPGTKSLAAKKYGNIEIPILTTDQFRLRIRPIPAEIPSGRLGPGQERPESMTPPSRPAQPPEAKPTTMPCKHPRVRVVAREEDSEFVECLECGEVFESSEFKDMAIEETKLAEEDA
jgi:hypothetical protein